MSINPVNNLANITEILGNMQVTDVSDEVLAQIQQTFAEGFSNSEDATQGVLADSYDQISAASDALLAQINTSFSSVKDASAAESQYITGLANQLLDIVYTGNSGYRQQSDFVNSVVNSVIKKYMTGKISKDEIISTITAQLEKSSIVDSGKLTEFLNSGSLRMPEFSAALESTVEAVDKANVYKEKYQLAQCVEALLAASGAAISNDASRQVTATDKPYYSPAQETLGEELQGLYQVGRTIGKYKPDGAKKAIDIEIDSVKNDAVQALVRALGGYVETTETTTGTGSKKKTVTTYNYIGVSTRSAEELNGLSAGEVQNALDVNNNNYTALEKMYLAGYNVGQAANALATMFAGAGVGYDPSTNVITIPEGVGDAKSIFTSMYEQVASLWGSGVNIVRGVGSTASARTQDSSTLGFSLGDTKYDFVYDNNQNYIMDDSSELMSSLTQLRKFDLDNNGIIEGSELNNLMIVRSDQDLFSQSNYDFVAASEIGITKIDLSSYSSTGNSLVDFNGNSNTARFNMTVGGSSLDAYEIRTTEQYLDVFYSFLYGANYRASLDEDDIAEIMDDYGFKR